MVDDRKSPDSPTRRNEVEGEGAIRGTGRAEAFADSVFSIAFTLPIVGIVMPAINGDGAKLGHELAVLAPAYGGYILASVVIGLYWVLHHFSGAIFRSTGHWFALATTLFLAVIGFIAFPARVIAAHFSDVAARPASVQYWVVSLAVLSLAWLLKWSVGVSHGHIDKRLEHAYVGRLTRRYRVLAALYVVAAMLVFWHWPSALLLSGILVASLLIPPETPRYTTEAPVIEGEG